MEVEKINDISNLKCHNGVIAIAKDGEVFVSRRNEINTRHWCCYDDIEESLNLNSDCGTDAMGHAWFMAKNGFISMIVEVIDEDLICLITSPKVETLEFTQLEKLYEVLQFNFKDSLPKFSISLGTENDNEEIEENGKYDFGFEKVNQTFNFDSLSKPKRR